MLDETSPTAPSAPRLVILHHELVAAATRCGGECLSSPAEAHAHPGQVRWRCRAGHEFVAARHAVVSKGVWCQECLGPAASRGSLRERIVRAFFQALFGVLFLRVRPGWTTELDGFAPELRLAWEHQGRQHFTWVRRFHATKGEFKRQRRRDREKVEACRRRGILLIVVPSLYDMLPEADLRAFIRAACERAGRADLLPADFDTREIDLSGAYCPDYAQDYAWLCAQAKEAGARIEEAGWMGDDYPYHFACTTPGCGRRWRRTATSFRHQRVTLGGRAGCAGCSAKLGAVAQRADLDKILERARAKEISVLSSPEAIYAGPDARCTLRCERCRAAGRTEEEATWTVTRAVLTKLIFGCATCAGKGRLTEQDIRARAKSRRWEVVAMPCPLKDNRDKVTVRCERGHTFQKVIHALTASGCPECYRPVRRKKDTRRLTQAVAETLALAAGWVLHSTYTNSKIKMRYTCRACGTEVSRSHNALASSPCPGCGAGGGSAPPEDGGEPGATPAPVR